MHDYVEDIEELDNVNKRVKKQNIYGLEKEVEELIKGLKRYKKPNVIIIGDAGVGKTTLVEKLAKEINDKEICGNLKNKKIYELTLNDAIAGTRYRGDFEGKVKNILDFISKNKNIILFVDEIHNLMNFGNVNEGSMSLSETLKPYLARGDIQLIGATTEKEYKKYIEKDEAFNRRFYKIKIKEPPYKEVLKMLEINKENYDKHYDINLNKKDFEIVMKNSKKRKGKYPDKAFDELEDYCYRISKNNI